MSLTQSSYFLLEDGTVKVTGLNNNGQLGIGNTIQQYSPVDIPNLTGVKQISSGYRHTIFLLEDGTVKATGYNSDGQLGIGNTIQQYSPVNIPNLTGVKQISCGYYHTIFLLEDGTVKATGYNSFGQLGIGNTTRQNSPVDIPNLTGVKQISCGYSHTIFLLEDGTVKATGRNNNGQLGIGNTIQQYSPVNIPNLTGVKQISCGYYHTIFLLEDGTVKATGYNSFGQLGIGNATQQKSPVDIPNLTGVKQISCGYSHTIFLLEDGTVKATGRNEFGQLGIGNTTQQNSPVDIPNLTGVKQISCGYNHTIFLLEDGTVKATGYNEFGQLGIGNTIQQYSPVDIPISNVKMLWDVYQLLKSIVNKYLFQDGEEIKKYAESIWSVVGVSPATKEMFDKHGRVDLSFLTEEVMNGLSSNSPNLLCWTDEEEPERRIKQEINNWIPLSDVMPSREIFLEEGMLDLLSIPEEAWSEFEGDFDVITYTNKDYHSVQLNGTPLGQLILSEVDFSQVEYLTVKTSKEVKLIVSGDDGLTWKIFNSEWKSIEANVEDASKYGMTSDIFNSITEEQWRKLGPDIRLGYYIEDEGMVESVEVTQTPVATETPSLNSIKVVYDDFTIEGRLKDLERINAINMAKLQFKTNALMESEKYKLHELVVDTFESDTMRTISSNSSQVTGEKQEIFSFSKPKTFEHGYISKIDTSQIGAMKKWEVK